MRTGGGTLFLARSHRHPGRVHGGRLMARHTLFLPWVRLEMEGGERESESERDWGCGWIGQGRGGVQGVGKARQGKVR